MERIRKFKNGLSGKFKKSINAKVDDAEETPSMRATTALTLHVNPAAPSSSSAKASSVTAIIAQPASSDVDFPHSSYDLDPWTRAYEIFQDRESELAADYKKHLQVGITSSVDFSTPLSVESIVKRLLEDREEKQWQVPLLGKNIKIREQVERLAKFVLWSDEIVKSALSAQPYAALAWSGVSILLPVSCMTLSALERMLTRAASYERHQAE